MQTSLRKIGNSRGVIIPSAFIEQLHIENEIEMIVKDGALILRPSGTPRKGWFDGYDKEKDTEEPLSELVEMESEQDEWEW
jgi:antitoxin MazE